MELPPSVRSKSEEEEGGGETTVRECCGLCCWESMALDNSEACATTFSCSLRQTETHMRAHKHTQSEKKQPFAAKSIIRGYYPSLERLRMSRN